MNPSIPSTAQNFKAGDKLAGCYTLKELLPSQGFCVVWLAHDEELGKEIVLHFVPDSVAADSRARTELKQEAKRNRQLIHPRIIRVHDLVEDERWAAISMDYVQGETLAALQKKRDKNAMDPSALSTGVAELCQTLEDAHRIDLFHRDLSPENLVATANGLMVQKFGISRVILDSLGRSGQKIDGSRDIAYISPQQLDGERPSRSDDIYSLGACLFDLLTGAVPFTEGDIAGQIRKSVPPHVSQRRTEKGISGEPIPKAWDEAIAACLAKTPDERPKSAAEAGGRFVSGKAGSAPVAAAAGAATPAPAAPTEKAATPESEPAAAKGAPAGQEAGAKQQKRPWASGPGKTPVIAEATVLSNTPVPKGEAAAESATGKSGEASSANEGGAGAKKGVPAPTTPSGFPLGAFVAVDGDAKRPEKKSSNGPIIAGVVFVLVLILGYLVAKNGGSSSNPAPENSAASTGTNAETQTAATESASPAPMSEAATSAPQPVNGAAASPTAAAPVAAPVAEPVAEAPASAPVPVAGLASMTDDQLNQLASDKAKAVDQAKAALADAEKASNDKAAAQAQAATALQELQGTIKQKADAAAAAKKAADDAAATLKQQQDSLQKAEADAADAQKIAAAKAHAADEIRKTMQDAQTAVQQQQTAQQQAEADAGQASKTIADRQKAADVAAKAAADAEKARLQQAQALAQAQADLGQVQASIQQAQQNQAAEKARKATEEAARIKKAREAETARLAAQAAVAAKAAADAQKALDAAKQAVADAEKAQQAAEEQMAAAQKGILPTASPAPVPEAPPAPAATPPAGASASPAASVSGPTLSVRAPNPHLKVDQALNNSLGMRFAPVGKIFFCIWITRVQDFEAFANATGYKGTAWRDPGFKQGPDHPVVNVSWNDANQFCLWLTEKEHRDGILSANETYRLPTDLEWSAAVGLPAESGRTPESRDMDVPDVYPWGNQWPPPSGAGNYTGEETDSDVAIKGYNDGFAWTSPVGSFNANKYGLYDMGGNVWEWCEDWWNLDQKAKVLRGGSWYNGALKLSLLSSCRIHAGADEGTDNYGFRIVLAEEMSKPKRHPLPGASPAPRRS